MMNIGPHRILFGAGLALLVGAAGAQTGVGSTPSTATAEPSSQPTAKISGQATAQAADPEQIGTDMRAQQQGKQVHHTAKRSTRHDQVAVRGESSYQQALRQCVNEKDRNERDSCLDNAIAQFQRNA